MSYQSGWTMPRELEKWFRENRELVEGVGGWIGGGKEDDGGVIGPGAF